MNLSHTRRCLFFHVPRTGGSSIESLGWWDQWTGHFPEADEIDVPDNYLTFAFVRDPWDRFVSLYHYFTTMTPEHRWYRTNRQLVAGVRRFRSFAEFCRGFHAWPQRDDFHFWPQYRWITDTAGKPLVNSLGRYENLQQDFAGVCRSLGVDCVELPRHNASRHKPFREYYDDHTWRIVCKLYRRDIALFQYGFRRIGRSLEGATVNSQGRKPGRRPNDPRPRT